MIFSSKSWEINQEIDSLVNKLNLFCVQRIRVRVNLRVDGNIKAIIWSNVIVEAWVYGLMKSKPNDFLYIVKTIFFSL